MSECLHLSHPLSHLPGASQPERNEGKPDPDGVKIDDRKIADFLQFAADFSRQVNFYDQNLDISDWQPFFDGSIPFTIARIAGYDPDSLEREYAKITDLITRENSPDLLQWLVDFIFNEVLLPWNQWFNELAPGNDSLFILIRNAISSELSNALKSFIALVNGLNKHFNIRKPNFQGFQETSIWRLEFAELFSLKDTFIHAPGGVAGRLGELLRQLDAIFGIFQENLRILTAEASVDDFLAEESLLENELINKRHAPHLGLFYTFLRLYKYLQSSTNEITKKHLDFFYKEVLCLQPGEPVPDQTHIIFELQKFTDKYFLDKNLALKDGKDANNVDIIFHLDDNIVVNKTQATSFKTLFLQFTNLHEGGSFKENLIEGLYAAPIANSKDGNGEAFGDEDSKSWQGLGAKESKLRLEGKKQPENQPGARIGFVITSPVLLLREGKRTITLDLTCLPDALSRIGVLDLAKFTDVLNESHYFITDETLELAGKESLTSPAIEWLNGFKGESLPYYIGINTDLVDDNLAVQDDKDIVKGLLTIKKPFNIYLSGEEEWLKTENYTATLTESGSEYLLSIVITLQPDFPAVTFYDNTILTDGLDTHDPAIKIELDPDVKILCESEIYNPECCLERCHPEEKVALSTYEYLRHLLLTDAKIDVCVCGLRNFIVQNDENLQDVNNLILPFGPRPKVNTNFYIGSEELFCKNWEKFWVHVNWKDKPDDFKKHYEHYIYEPFEDLSTEISDNSFKVEAAVLQDGKWKVNGEKELFLSSDAKDGLCVGEAIESPMNTYAYVPVNFTDYQDNADKEIPKKFDPLTVNTQNGFLRLTLQGVSFQHDRYPFVLARHMMSLANLVDPISYAQALTFLVESKAIVAECVSRVHSIQSRISTINGRIANLINNLIFNNIGPVNLALDGIKVLIGEMNGEIGAAIADLTGTPNVGNALGHLNTADQIGQAIDDRIGDTATAGTIHSDANIISDNVSQLDDLVNFDIDNDFSTYELNTGGIHELIHVLQDRIDVIKDLLHPNEDLKTGLPNEPYTPTIREISLDYKANASKNQVGLIHLYPFENTFSKNKITGAIPILPAFDDEGTLFIGLEAVTPASNLNLLFQLAETTADSETEKAIVSWSYLTNNQWRPLRPGFEIIDDDTESLTKSGIVKIAIPRDISLEKHSIMPDSHVWLKVAAEKNVKAVAEIIGIHAQAIMASFSIEENHDLNRLAKPLSAGSIAKLHVADANIKKVDQPYDSFNGRVNTDNFYVRVSEHLRHKGKGIAAFGYERLVMKHFTEVFRAKCIQHTYKLSANSHKLDLEIAPGHVLLAVIPDVTLLPFKERFAPQFPHSKLLKIEDFMADKVPAFVALKASNPRYEKVNVGVRLVFKAGFDESYFKEKLVEDIKLFFSPWAEGNLDELVFWRNIGLSALLYFIEIKEYVDYIMELQLIHADDLNENCKTRSIDLCPCDEGESGRTIPQEFIAPLTARSILIAGDIQVTVCIPDCPPEPANICNQTLPFHQCEPVVNHE